MPHCDTHANLNAHLTLIWLDKNKKNKRQLVHIIVVVYRHLFILSLDLLFDIQTECCMRNKNRKKNFLLSLLV